MNENSNNDKTYENQVLSEYEPELKDLRAKARLMYIGECLLNGFAAMCPEGTLYLAQ